jgi:MerR family transcriptional regulator/heat shock protein HspR
MLDKGRPVYTIGTAAELLGVHPRTLRLYEDGGLLRPARKNNRRFYSTNDLQWIGCIRYLLHEKGLNQEGLRRVLALMPCWEIRGCSPEAKESCASWSERSTPCWDVARRSGSDSRRCFECAVYLGAADFVLDPEEREEALNYIVAG